jgi:hypothetical protein
VLWISGHSVNLYWFGACSGTHCIWHAIAATTDGAVPSVCGVRCRGIGLRLDYSDRHPVGCCGSSSALPQLDVSALGCLEGISGECVRFWELCGLLEGCSSSFCSTY